LRSFSLRTGYVSPVDVSDNLQENTEGQKFKPSEEEILKPDRILHKDKTCQKLPDCTSSWPGYFGGYSNHLQVFAGFK
jgi:hypothetical protein